MVKFRKERYITQIERNGWSFRVRYRNIDKIFTEKEYGSPQVAFRMAVDFRNSMLVGGFIPKDVTVDQCFNELNDFFVLRSETQRKMECFYEKYISFKDKPIKDVTRADVIYDLNQMVYSCSNDTIKRVLSIWRKIFSLAVAKDYINKDVTVNIPIPKSHRLKPTPRNELTDEQTLITLSDSLSKRLKTAQEREQARYILLTLFYTGLRPTELFALTTDDVNLKRKEIIVNKELESDRNKKDVIRPCKTEMSHRIVPLSDKAIGLLKDYVPDGDIFFGVNNKHYVIADIGNRYHQIAKSIGIDFHLYQCRHTFITNLYLNGIDLKTIQEIVGQNVDSTTIGYVVTNEDRKRKAVNII